jgi:uncharacterized membrane protein YeaQ/YmgE (transglycosylase-associated protein family)
LSWTLTCVLGMAGSVGAQLAGQALGWYVVGEPSGWIASVLGALLLLFVGSKLQRRKPS